ncbi:MAG: hypothetical protein WA802_01460, partial [Terracidiphilus sp.]
AGRRTVPLRSGNILRLGGVTKDMTAKLLPEQLLQALAAPFASLFLVLALLAALPVSQASGVWFELLREGQQDCGDARTEVVHLEPGQGWMLNEKQVGASKMPQVVAQAMANRAERVIHFIPDRNVTVQEIASLATATQAETDSLHIGLVTHRQLVAMTQDDNGIRWVPVGCMRWPRCPGPIGEDVIPILRGCR